MFPVSPERLNYTDSERESEREENPLILSTKQSIHTNILYIIIFMNDSIRYAYNERETIL